MKKQKLKALKLKKKKISNLTELTVQGGLAATGFLSCAPEPIATQRQTCQYSCKKQSCYCL